MSVRFPDVEVQLSGEDGNAFAILGRVSRGLRSGGATKSEIDEFMSEATSSDYENLLATCMRWVSVN